ncbi:MAG TPA: hypothetical protein VFE72_02780 [Lysobacter sp.]|nr:hypothetical protein [Lysobacter sp.]
MQQPQPIILFQNPAEALNLAAIAFQDVQRSSPQAAGEALAVVGRFALERLQGALEAAEAQAAELEQARAEAAQLSEALAARTVELTDANAALVRTGTERDELTRQLSAEKLAHQNTRAELERATRPSD